MNPDGATRSASLRLAEFPWSSASGPSPPVRRAPLREAGLNPADGGSSAQYGDHSIVSDYVATTSLTHVCGPRDRCCLLGGGDDGITADVISGDDIIVAIAADASVPPVTVSERRTAT
ncbi:hypothetical protein EYF80_038442 [Liparis tanakae]|uniref:Uncharacterized protein n=1 Tax=Liparis tanakae TaxID=230148 RepID=A0A4Z2GF66_9TELE|nr:hypothetical protein EYF80_038442 [Liparis tanakae]